MSAIETVRVSVGDGYDIHIGDDILERGGELLRPLLHRPWVVVVSDEQVFRAQGDRLLRGLGADGVACAPVILPPGEATKSFAGLERLANAMIAHGVERRDIVIALGGGVIGDLAGFAASIVKRGCRYVQAPTSLLAQVDSAVGGKTAINTEAGKNLVGAFHQPAMVLADISALTTLSPRELRAGYAEVVKYGALGDASFFAWLEKNGAALIGGDAVARAEAVRRSCAAKAAIVAADEREIGVRALLNLGHTFGHALETAFGHGERLLHGEAVAVGMGLAFDFSVELGHCRADDAARLKSHLRAVGLPADLSDIAALGDLSADDLASVMAHDKKVEGGRLTLILVRRLGEAFIQRDADAGAVKEFLSRTLASRRKP